MSEHFSTLRKILQKGFNGKKFFKVIAIIIIILAALIIVKDEMEYQLGIGFWAEEGGYADEFMEKYPEEPIYTEECNVSGILLHGELVTYLDESSEFMQTSSEDIVYYIEDAEMNDQIKAIVLEVDSLGGYAVADEEVADALKRATKPTVALVRGSALSAAYYAITGADIIFAAKESEIGSLGASFSYLDYTKQNQNEGITFNQISSGKYKDLMSPDKPLTDEERILLMRDIEIMNDNFIRAVAENRNLEIDKVRQLADGSSMLGKMAIENGLIDRIGSYYEVKEYLKELIGEDIEICW